MPVGNGAVHPYSFASGSIGGAPLPKPPPTSYMRNPYLAQPPTASSSHKRTSGASHNKTSSNSNSNSNGSRQGGGLQTSTDLYSPKKYNSNSNNSNSQQQHHHQSKKMGGGGGLGMALDLTPQGIYVPPRTSHSTIRGAGGSEKAPSFGAAISKSWGEFADDQSF